MTTISLHYFIDRNNQSCIIPSKDDRVYAECLSEITLGMRKQNATAIHASSGMRRTLRAIQKGLNR